MFMICFPEIWRLSVVNEPNGSELKIMHSIHDISINDESLIRPLLMNVSCLISMFFPRILVIKRFSKQFVPKKLGLNIHRDGSNGELFNFLNFLLSKHLEHTADFVCFIHSLKRNLAANIYLDGFPIYPHW